ncbi:MAG: radical SAM protein [Elusimicrobia bacterium]|nr:radical SAM protein [Elusimicrobiota bacterium]
MTVELFAKGCLDACWYGAYHYVEPWVGCGHGCHYCYARFRGAVRNSLAARGAAYERPVPLLERKALLDSVRRGVKEHQVESVKLCRFTDIMNPAFVKDGLALGILEALLEGGARRMIITTKGLPDARIMDLISRHPDRFSYNAAARPARGLPLEPGLPPLAKRLDAAARLKAAGVLVTVHLDPMAPGFDDDPESLRPFLEDLRARGLQRAMFSYLLINPAIRERLSKKLPPAVFERILGSYDLRRPERMLPGQEETDYFTIKPEIRRASVERVVALLDELGFQYVLCSLKSVAGDDQGKLGKAKLCDGSFYA